MCSSSDATAGSACDCRDVRYNGRSLPVVFGNVPCPPRFSSRGQLCSTKYIAMRTGLFRLIPANNISVILLKILLKTAEKGFTV